MRLICSHGCQTACPWCHSRTSTASQECQGIPTIFPCVSCDALQKNKTRTKKTPKKPKQRASFPFSPHRWMSLLTQAKCRWAVNPRGSLQYFCSTGSRTARWRVRCDSCHLFTPMDVFPFKSKKIGGRIYSQYRLMQSVVYTDLSGGNKLSTYSLKYLQNVTYCAFVALIPAPARLPLWHGRERSREMRQALETAGGGGETLCNWGQTFITDSAWSPPIVLGIWPVLSVENEVHFFGEF